jgi:hypothetical protein
MEAPAKSGGTRKMRPRRDLIGRLRTLPPIEFLKKHNPLRRRRKGPQLGFDQPIQEIKRLALPLRPAPPSLSMRMYLRLRPAGAWVVGRCRAAADATGRLMQASAVRFRMTVDRAWARLQPLFAALASTYHAAIVRAARIRHTRTVRWCEHRIAAFAQRLAALQPAVWQPTQTSALLARTQRVRRTLIGLVACEWTALVGLMIVLTGLAVTGRMWDRGSINACALILSIMALAGLGLQAWHHRLIAAWQAMELFICGDCGSLRNFSPSRPCPKCDTQNSPVFPGQVPAYWTRRAFLVSPLAAGTPALLACMLLLTARLL